MNISQKQWTAIILTAATAEQASIYQRQLDWRKRIGLIEPDVFTLAVPDPSSARIGSGGATLNALAAATERLSAMAGRSVIEAELLRDAKLLIVHSGGDSQRFPAASVCGKAFSSLPLSGPCDELMTPFDLLLKGMSRLFSSSSAGLAVASCDVILEFPDTSLDWTRDGITGIAIPVDKEYGPNHGVYHLEPDASRVHQFIQKGSIDALQGAGAIRNDGRVMIDTGVVYFSPSVTEKLLSFHVRPPLDACTYIGIDNGAAPLRLELYSDILPCMASSADRDSFLSETTTGSATLGRARELIWNELHGIEFHAVPIEDGRFFHLGTLKEYMHYIAHEAPRDEGAQHGVHAFFESERARDERSIVINSIIAGGGQSAPDSLVEHCELKGRWSLGRGAFCSGLESFSGIHVPERVALQEIRLKPGENGVARRVITLYGVDDAIKQNADAPDATFLNAPWSTLWDRAGNVSEDIWPDIEPDQRRLWNARLYPVLDPAEWPEIVLWMIEDHPPAPGVLRRWRYAPRLSLSEILTQADIDAELEWRREAHFRVDAKRLEASLLESRDDCLLSLFERYGLEGRTALLETFDAIASIASPQALPRIFSSMADALAAFAGAEAGLRSGPARNADWAHCFETLQQGDQNEAVALMAAKRREWMESPDQRIRAARHYDSAVQILIQQSVDTAPVEWDPVEAPETGVWAEAESPARIDLAGGWTDTPPITYETGGAVVNAAILIDDQRSISAKARRIEAPELVIHLQSGDAPLVCRRLEDISDYAHPLAPGALIKAAVLCLGLVDLTSSTSLQDQLLKQTGGGLEIKCSSNLPTGSGLGTSSILAGAVIACLGRVCGKQFTQRSLIHLVLKLEQWLTTGGGWQDQVGGLLPGVKLARSEASLPLTVETSPIEMPDGFLSDLNARLAIAYTGRTRLARNLLQNVIRRWYARTPDIMHLTRALRDNACEMKNALESGDLEGAGRSLARYWEQKKGMTDGAEPAYIAKLMEAARPLCHGASLAGAGGGGFMTLLLKEPGSHDELRERWGEAIRQSHVSIHQADIDQTGLVIN